MTRREGFIIKLIELDSTLAWSFNPVDDGIAQLSKLGSKRGE